MNIKAKIAFAFPHSNKSGARKNSNAFITAMISICATELSREYLPLSIQIAIPISESPIRNVRDFECSFPKILATTC